VRPRLIEIGDIFLLGPAQLEHAHHQHVIQTFPPQTPHKAFTNRIRPWRRVGRVDQLNAGCFGHPFKHWTVLFVMVTDQILRLLNKRCRVAHLLCDPLVRRMFGHAEVHHAPAFMLHDHKRMNRLEKQRHHGHEITSPDVLTVRFQEGKPRLSRRGR
jgi:hypothetical protein